MMQMAMALWIRRDGGGHLFRLTVELQRTMVLVKRLTTIITAEQASDAAGNCDGNEPEFAYIDDDAPVFERRGR